MEYIICLAVFGIMMAVVYICTKPQARRKVLLAELVLSATILYSQLMLYPYRVERILQVFKGW